MPSKRTYRATRIQSLDTTQLVERLPDGAPVVVGLDVAKHKMLVNLATGDNETLAVVRFQHPQQTGEFAGLLEELKRHGHRTEVALEPTGTYGDAIRHQLQRRDIPVYRVSTKHVSDATEVYDGVPSKHDAKDACVITWLHLMGRSAPWTADDELKRNLRSLVALRDVYDAPLRRTYNQLGALLARHFPEFEGLYDVRGRKTPLVLLAEFGSPAAIGETPVEDVAAVIRRASRRRPDRSDVEDLVQRAADTVGVPMVDGERELVRTLAKEAIRLLDARKVIDEKIKVAGAKAPAIASMRSVLGAVTAAVVVAHMGSPEDYGSAAAVEKAAGLNLTEHSSGKRKGGVHISKRGPARVRKYLFIAAMRLVQTDPIVRAWYRRRRAYTEEAKLRALLAVVRKLARALVHVARGAAFDASKLFDVRRLDLAVAEDSGASDELPDLAAVA
ncbi:MAG: IS110 family transposase [Myxococcales bacterium]|nr:IS110 family transposase [Myxococcales bacterium]